MALLALLAWQASRAEEIAPFVLTGIEGWVLLDYLHDGLSTRQSGTSSGTSDQKQDNLREEIFVMTHSYVYHPNFLTMDIGGGPVRQDARVDLGGDRTDGGKTLFNFSGRANFLRDKPINGSLFYDQMNPTVSVAPGEIMVQETSRYGFDFFMSSPTFGFPFNVGYVNTSTQGSGSGRILDDELEQFNLNVNRSYGALGSTSLQYQYSDQTSRSGSLDLPIQSTTSTNEGLSVNTQLQFGPEQAYNLTNNIFYNTWQTTLDQGSLPEQSNFGFLLDLRGRPAKDLTVFANYNQNRNDQGIDELVTQTLSGGLTYLPLQDLETNLSIRLERSDADQYELSSWVVDGSVRYNRPLWLGSLQVNYGAKYGQRDQQASDPLVDVIDEQHALPGTVRVPLSHPNVVSGSVSVTNQAQTQTFIENVDYLLIVVGAETSLQRLASGSILDGEVVLVDYTYDIGGTYAYAQLDQTLNLNWNIARNFDAYFRWYDSSPEITSGVSTFPLNTVQDVLLGMRAEVPFNLGFSVGGSYELEDRDETISPFQRGAGDLFLQTTESLFGMMNLRLTGRLSRIDYEFSDQDVDLTGYELRVWTRRFGIDLTGLLNYEEDVGGPTPSKRQDASLNAVWRERKVTVTAAFTYSHEVQGDYERDHTLFRLTGRRDF